MKRQLLQAAGGVALVRMAGMAAAFALTVVLARTLGADGLGLYGFVLLLISLAGVPVSYGWATLLLRSISSALANGGWSEARGIQWAASIVAVAVALLALMAGLIWALLKPESWLTPLLALTLAGILLCDQFSALRLATLRGLGHPVWGQLPETLLRPGLVLAVFLGSVWAAGASDINLAFGALLVASLVSVAVGTIILKMKSPIALVSSPPDREWKRWSMSSSLLASNSGLIILNGQADFLMLGLLASAADLGHYRVASQIALVSGFGYVALNMIAAQRFAYLFAAKDMAGLQASATFMARIAFAMTLPLPVIFWFWGEPILEIVFGPGFQDAWLPTMILLAVQSLSAACGFNQSMLVMSGAVSIVAPVTAISMAVCVLSCYLLVPTMGGFGAALSALLGQAIWNISLTVLAARRFGVDVSLLGLRQQSITPESKLQFSPQKTLRERDGTMKRSFFKRLAIDFLSVGWINRIAVGLAWALPGGEWRARLPVIGAVGRLDLGKGETIELSRVDKCGVAREIYWHRGHLGSAADRRALQLAIDLSDRPGTLLDIGSYTGLFALAVARSRPGVTAHAFEIVPENFLLLWENIIGNNLLRQVRPHLTGIGAERGSLRMPAGFGPGVLATSADLGTGSMGEGGVEVPVESLDTLFAGLEGGLVIKIDVEGYEWPVLAGGEDLIGRLKPDIICEILRRAPDVPRIEAFLARHGYTAYRITGAGLAGPNPITGVKLERDWLFTRRNAAELEALGHPILSV